LTTHLSMLDGHGSLQLIVNTLGVECGEPLLRVGGVSGVNDDRASSAAQCMHASIGFVAQVSNAPDKNGIRIAVTAAVLHIDR
jgi:hypothetical protein